MSVKYSRGIAFCLIATVAWGGMFPVMTSALRHIDPFTFTCMRYGLAGLAFLALLLIREGRSGLSLKGERAGLAWFFGTAGFAGFQFLVFFGQKSLGPGGALIASVMMATMPMLGFLVNWLVRRAAPPLGALGFIAMSFAGVTLVITKGHYGSLISHAQNYRADGLIILGALCWVIYTVGAAFFPRWSPIRYTTITTGLGLLSACAITIVILAAHIAPVPSPHVIGTVLPELAYMSIVAAFVGVLCWNIGNKILTPLNGVLFMDVVPVTAYLISALTGVIPAAMQILGASICAVALILNNLYLRHRLPSRPPVPATQVDVLAERGKDEAARGA